MLHVSTLANGEQIKMMVHLVNLQVFTLELV